MLKVTSPQDITSGASPHETAPARRPLFRLGLIVLGVFLAWQVIVHSWAHYLAEPAPSVALMLNSRQPDALRVAAERKLEEILTAARSSYAEADRDRLPAFSDRRIVGVPDESTLSDLPPGFVLSAKDAAEVEDLLRRSIAAAPLNARAFSLLGRVADLKQDEAQARTYYRQAARLSRHEVSAAIWLLNHAIKDNSVDEVLSYADLLQRVRPSIVAPIAPILARVAESEDGRQKLITLLAGDPPPPWRSAFLRSLPQHVIDPRTPMDVVFKLKGAGVLVDADDLRPYLDLLLRNGLADLAYQTWLQFLSDQQLSTLGRLNNAGFERPPSGLPFDWVIRAGTNANAEILPHPEHPERKVLIVDFRGGRAQFQAGVRQWVVLPPGAYRLAGAVEGDLRGRRGLKWRILCQEAGRTLQLAESEMLIGKFAEGRSFSFDFTVPNSDCAAQIVQLDLDARSSSEQLVLGELIFDDLRLDRLAASDTPAQ
jgi:hypothetical protein